MFHLLWDLGLRLVGPPSHSQAIPWYRQRLQVGEGKYLLFLLLMSGFWTCENQLAMTLPEYIRDYVDSRDLVASFQPLASFVCGLLHSVGVDTSSWSRGVLDEGRVKPEHLINLNSLGIIFLQIVISYAARKLPPLVTIVSGVLLTAASFLLFVPFGKSGTGWLVVIGVLSYSVGEMLASPKSKEYAGRIAPPDKVGLYMGYFYLCVALGNLFGGLLSGAAYQHFGKRGVDRPDLLFALIASLAVGTALLLWLYDRYLRSQQNAGERILLGRDEG